MSFDLLTYSLYLADTTLVLGHRNSEWTGHGPILEQDIALSNIALDLIGQARNFYQLAATLRNDGSSEDDLAYHRGPSEYLNCLMAEQENGHWGRTVLRQFFISSYLFPLYQILQREQEQQLAAIAEKSLKEVTYHLRWSSEWVIRLGLGTTTSREKMQQALHELWMFTEELVTPAPYEPAVAHSAAFRAQVNNSMSNIIEQASLEIPRNINMQFGGKSGKHTPALHELLSEMQHLQRTYPGLQW